MPRSRKTTTETKYRKARVELHNIKGVVRWAISQLRVPGSRTTAEIADELARVIGEKIIPAPANTSFARASTTRRWSPEQTEECPIPDTLRGGYCESDAQLRDRLGVG